MEQTKTILKKTWVVAALACVCCLLWGSAIPLIKTGYRLMQMDSADTASQIVFAGVRFALAGILVGVHSITGYSFGDFIAFHCSDGTGQVALFHGTISDNHHFVQ